MANNEQPIEQHPDFDICVRFTRRLTELGIDPDTTDPMIFNVIRNNPTWMMVVIDHKGHACLSIAEARESYMKILTHSKNLIDRKFGV